MKPPDPHDLDLPTRLGPSDSEDLGDPEQTLDIPTDGGSADAPTIADGPASDPAAPAPAEDDGLIDAPTRMLPADTPSLADAARAREQEDQSDTIKNYRIVEVLGEGGMGVVYKAEQIEPVQRNVALKIIKLGMDTKEVVTRFEAERQALAVMDHPSIASVYDAGATSRGRPYFVMELVAGTPITKFCDKNRLSTRRRLELFIRVCRGVQHAHQKGVMHRDLKPSNILISEAGNQALPKIIDFGIAKATTQSGDEKALATQMGQLLGTPEYMSPEQAELSGANVDTRTDVYSLGVVLYEMMTGTLPFSTKDLRRGGMAQMQKILQESLPPTPSKRVTMLGRHTDVIAKRRSTDGRGLNRQLHGDLDWVVMKAMEKDPARRYATVNALANDLQAYLDNEIVTARPPSTAYRVSKFVRRNRLAVAFSGALVLAMIAGMVGTGVGLVRSQREAGKAQAVNRFLENMLIAVNPAQARGRDVTVRDVLDESSQSVGDSFGDQPEVEASLRHTIGKTYQRLGFYVEAEPHFLRSIELKTELYGKNDQRTLDSLNQLAINYFRQRRSEAEELFRTVTEVSTAVRGAEDPATLTGMNNLAAVYLQSLRYEEAEPLLVQVLEGRRSVLGKTNPQTLATQSNLAHLYKDTGRFDQAQALLQEVRVARLEDPAFGADHPRTMATTLNLADVYRQSGRIDDAAPLYAETLEQMRRVLGADHPYTLEALFGQADVLLARDRLVEAEPLIVENLERRSNRYGDTDEETMWAIDQMARFEAARGNLDVAAAIQSQQLEKVDKHFDPDHPLSLTALCGRVEVLTQLERREEALESAQELEARVDALPEKSYVAAARPELMTRIYTVLGRDAEADAWRRRSNGR